MKAAELISALSQKLGTTSQSELANVLGITVGTLINWKNRDEDLSALQVASALAKSRSAAVRKSQFDTIQPIVELYAISRCESPKSAGWLVFNGGVSANLYAKGLRDALCESYGIYIFYDSRGSALYVGKAKEQTIWKEMNLAYNRKRDIQKISLVNHPNRNQEFKPGYEKLRQPKDTQLELFDLACYFSAYHIDDGMIDDLEALMVRGFINDLLNVRIETFSHAR
ncbi:transposase [Massilia aurea]|uniref:Transposase n=1 Tax=Massilia aurea TaxID=373040 RepID=A0A7W9U7H9_9BURK|nr:helix-turn-helix domain-containing protein [Massilia aurea]MBB6132430.1 transposase [Massilia aurea]